MDPLTHFILTHLLARILKIDNKYRKYFLIGGIIPDIDLFTIVFGLSFLLNFHATLTHSFFILPIVAIIISTIFFRKEWKKAFIFLLGGQLFHVLFDITVNLPILFTYGNLCITPFSMFDCLLASNLTLPPIVFILMQGTSSGICTGYVLFLIIREKKLEKLINKIKEKI